MPADYFVLVGQNNITTTIIIIIIIMMLNAGVALRVKCLRSLSAF